MFPARFDLFSLYKSFIFTASIIMDSLLDYLNVTTISTWYQSHFKQASSLSTLHYTPEEAGFPKKSRKECLASSKFIQISGAGVTGPGKVFMSRGKA